MQQGVSNLHMASSMLWDWKATRVASVDGVLSVTPILYMNAMVRIRGRNWFSYIVGLRAGATRGGPWKMRAGKSRPKSGEAVIPAVVARLTGLGIGDMVRIADRSLRVVGLSADTFSMANSVTFVAWDDLEAIMGVSGALSYLLVKATPDTDPATLARRIETDVEKVSALPTNEFVARDRRMALQMGTEIIRIMTLVGSVVATLIIAFTAYSQIVHLERELAVAKALGFRGHHLTGVALVQSGLVTVAGVAICAALAGWVVPLIPALAPEVSLRVTGAQFVRIALAALPIAALAGVVPAARIAQLDPMMVFKA